MFKLDKAIIVGDFDIHIEDTSNSFVTEFISITESFNLVQYVAGPTHNHGHTLDLVFTLGLNINSLCIEDIFVLDHKCIVFDLVVNFETQS